MTAQLATGLRAETRWCQSPVLGFDASYNAAAIFISVHALNRAVKCMVNSQIFTGLDRCLDILSPSFTSAPVGILNSQILGENDHHNHQIIHQLKVKDLLYPSVQESLIVENPLIIRRYKVAKLDV